MQLGVEIGDGKEIVGLAQALHVREDALEVLDVRGAGPLGRQACHESLEHGARLQDLHRLALGDEPDPGAAMAFVLHQALVLESHQRRPDQRAAHAQGTAPDRSRPAARWAAGGR